MWLAMTEGIRESVGKAHLFTFPPAFPWRLGAHCNIKIAFPTSDIPGLIRAEMSNLISNVPLLNWNWNYANVPINERE